MPSKKKQSKQSFAKDFEKLEQIVQQFENDEELDVDKSLKQFEAGLKLAESLKKTLDTVEQRIEILKSKYDSE